MHISGCITPWRCFCPMRASGWREATRPGAPTSSTWKFTSPRTCSTRAGALATRPTITSAPSAISWEVRLRFRRRMRRIFLRWCWCGTGAVTHAFNMDQRLVGMSFTAGSGGLDRDCAAQREHCPAGILHAVSGEQQRRAVGSEIYPAGLLPAGNPAPTVSAISPTSGTTAGGTPVTITGTGFLAGATVSLGGTAATGVTVVSSTSITATTAAHAAGAVNVVVTNTDAQSGTLTNGYTYTASNPAPTVSVDLADVGNDGGRDAGDDHGHGLPGGSDGESGRNGGDGGDGGEQHVDHGDDGGACGGRGERGGDQHGRPERHIDQRLYLHHQPAVAERSRSCR